MGMFSFVKKIVKKVAKPFVKVLPKFIAKPGTKVATSLSKLTPSTLLKFASQGPVLGPINFVAGSTAPKIARYVQLGSTIAASFINPTGATKMGINIGNLLGTIGGVIGKNNMSGNSFVSGLGGALTIASAIMPQRAAATPVVRKTAPVPMRPGGNVSVLPRAVSGLTQEIFNAGTKVLGRLGIPFVATAGSFSSALRRSLGSIASLARRTPAGTIVSILAGLGLTALEANMLAAWYAQRKKGRRMNPANSRALRRAARRIKSFHRLCTHTDVLKTRGRSRSVGRCASCRKSPCSC